MGWLLGLFWACLTLPFAASAEDETNDARWFEVELIIFAHNDPQALDAEQWPSIEGVELPLDELIELDLPPLLQGDEITQAEAENSDASLDNMIAETAEDGEAETAAAPEGPIAFQLLAEDAWQLQKTARRLQRSSRFEPLLHIAWRQPTYELARARPVLIYDGMDEPLPAPDEETETSAETDSGDDSHLSDEAMSADEAGFIEAEPVYATEADALIGPPNPRLIGTIKLSVARYLHLATDLLYRIPVTQQHAALVPDFDLWYDRPYPTLYEPQGPAYRLEEWQAIRGFRMLESRRMRSRVLHYLDHPFFGMVVLITPVELPQPEEASEGETPTPP